MFRQLPRKIYFTHYEQLDLYLIVKYQVSRFYTPPFLNGFIRFQSLTRSFNTSCMRRNYKEQVICVISFPNCSNDDRLIIYFVRDEIKL